MSRTYYDVVCVVNKCIESRHTGASSRLIKKHSQLRLTAGFSFVLEVMDSLWQESLQETPELEWLGMNCETSLAPAFYSACIRCSNNSCSTFGSNGKPNPHSCTACFTARSFHRNHSTVRITTHITVCFAVIGVTFRSKKAKALWKAILYHHWLLNSGF